MSSGQPLDEYSERFAFGKNWQSFAELVDQDRIDAAEESLREMLQCVDLGGARFLDVGCGSGLFSLAAWRLGARVHSFDYDPNAVQCTKDLRKRFASADGGWTIEQGSALDADYLSSLGVFDIVYAWGVLHHTGDMWTAMENVATVVAPGGRLFLSLYNDQGWPSEVWLRIKRRYVRSSPAIRRALVAAVGSWFSAQYALNDVLHGRRPTKLDQTPDSRGMSRRHDLIDWVGGYPYEVAKPGDVFDLYRHRGFSIARLNTTTGSGCNEFVLRRQGGAHGLTAGA